MFCQNCGASIADGAKFCPECGKRQEIQGSSVSMKKRCPFCGEALEADSVFCDYCGKPMCGCDVGYIGPFAVCTPCREKIKSVFAPSGDSNTKEGKGNG